MLTREQMIAECIEHEIEVNFCDRTYVREVLMTGMKGYDRMTDSEVLEYWESFQN